MNCECTVIYKPDRNDESKLHALACILSRYVSENVELYPVSISKVTKKTSAYKNYDRTYGKTVLQPGDYILFIAGKLHYMNKTTVKQYTPQNDKNFITNFEFLHPDTRDEFFTDILFFE